MKNTIKDFIFGQDLDGLVLKCKDGRKIIIDKLLDGTGYVVSVFVITGYAWDSDYKMDLPVQKLDIQKDLENKAAVADYITTLF